MSASISSSKSKSKKLSTTTTASATLTEHLNNSPYKVKMKSPALGFATAPSVNNISGNSSDPRNGDTSLTSIPKKRSKQTPNYRSPTFTSMNRKADIANVLLGLKAQPHTQQLQPSAPGNSNPISSSNSSSHPIGFNIRRKSKSSAVEDSNEPFVHEAIDLASLIDPASPRNKATSRKRATGTKNSTNITATVIKTTDLAGSGGGPISAAEASFELTGATKKLTRRRKTLPSSKSEKVETQLGKVKDFEAAAEIEDLVGSPLPTKPTKPKVRRKRKEVVEQSQSERSITSTSDRSKGGSIFNLMSEISSDNDDSFFFSSNASPKHEYPILDENSTQDVNLDAMRYVQSALSAWAKNSRGGNRPVTPPQPHAKKGTPPAQANSEVKGPNAEDQTVVKVPPQFQSRPDSQSEPVVRTPTIRKKDAKDNVNDNVDQNSKKNDEGLNIESATLTAPAQVGSKMSKIESPKKLKTKRPKTVASTKQEKESIKEEFERSKIVLEPSQVVITSVGPDNSEVEAGLKQSTVNEPQGQEKTPKQLSDKEPIDSRPLTRESKKIDDDHNKKNNQDSVITESNLGIKSPIFLDENGNCSSSHLSNISCHVVTVETQNVSDNLNSKEANPKLSTSSLQPQSPSSKKCLLSVSIQTITSGRQASVQTATSLDNLSSARSNDSTLISSGTDPSEQVIMKSQGVQKRPTSKRSKKSKLSTELAQENQPVSSPDLEPAVESQGQGQGQTKSKTKLKSRSKSNTMKRPSTTTSICSEDNKGESRSAYNSSFEDIPISYATTTPYVEFTNCVSSGLLLTGHGQSLSDTGTGEKGEGAIVQLMELGMEFPNENGNCPPIFEHIDLLNFASSPDFEDRETDGNNNTNSNSKSKAQAHAGVAKGDQVLCELTSSLILKDEKTIPDNYDKNPPDSQSFPFLDGQISTVGCSAKVSSCETKDKDYTDDDQENNNINCDQLETDDSSLVNSQQGDSHHGIGQVKHDCDCDFDGFIGDSSYHGEQNHETPSSQIVGVSGVAKTWSITSYNHPVCLQSAKQEMENEKRIIRPKSPLTQKQIENSMHQLQEIILPQPPSPAYAASTQTIDESNAECQVGHSLTTFDYLYEDEPQWFEGTMSVAEDFKELIDTEKINIIPESLVHRINTLEFGDISSNIEKISDTISTTFRAVTEIITEMVNTEEEEAVAVAQDANNNNNNNQVPDSKSIDHAIPILVESTSQTATVITSDRNSSPFLLSPPLVPSNDELVLDGEDGGSTTTIDPLSITTTTSGKEFLCPDLDPSLTDLSGPETSLDQGKTDREESDENHLDDDDIDDIILRKVAELLLNQGEDDPKPKDNQDNPRKQNESTKNKRRRLESSAASLNCESVVCFRELPSIKGQILESQLRLEQLVCSFNK